MNASVKYMAEIQRLVEKVSCEQPDSMERAASLIAEALCGEGYVFTFGTGHSHLLAEEIFYRAGGLARVCPILEDSLMLHRAAARSSQIERASGIAKPLLDDVDAVLIALPHQLHYPIGKFFIENGKHVLMEKPLCIKECQCLELTALAEKCNVTLMTAYPVRFWEETIKMKEYMELK